MLSAISSFFPRHSLILSDHSFSVIRTLSTHTLTYHISPLSHSHSYMSSYLSLSLSFIRTLNTHTHAYTHTHSPYISSLILTHTHTTQTNKQTYLPTYVHKLQTDISRQYFSVTPSTDSPRHLLMFAIDISRRVGGLP